MIVRVMIVYDNDAVRDGLRSLLRLDKDISVVGEATNGRDAFDKVPQFDPDVIVMDAQMPGMDGIEATRSIKQREPGRRILFFSLYNAFARDARDAGADAYLLKGCRREDLISTIRHLAAVHT